MTISFQRKVLQRQHLKFFKQLSNGRGIDLLLADLDVLASYYVFLCLDSILELIIMNVS